jgi:hypothetical protein
MHQEEEQIVAKEIQAADAAADDVKERLGAMEALGGLIPYV